MSDRDNKDLRKQLRNIVKEILPEVLTQELVADIKKQVTAFTIELDNKYKNIIGYIMRHSNK